VGVGGPFVQTRLLLPVVSIRCDAQDVDKTKRVR